VAVAVEFSTPSEFELAVARARNRAAATGEPRPGEKGLAAVPVPAELAEFVQRVLSDGTYARAVEQLGREDTNLATL
jgi:hypothetical protein